MIIIITLLSATCFYYLLMENDTNLKIDPERQSAENRKM